MRVEFLARFTECRDINNDITDIKKGAVLSVGSFDNDSFSVFDPKEGMIKTHIDFRCLPFLKILEDEK